MIDAVGPDSEAFLVPGKELVSRQVGSHGREIVVKVDARDRCEFVQYEAIKVGDAAECCREVGDVMGVNLQRGCDSPQGGS